MSPRGMHDNSEMRRMQEVHRSLNAGSMSIAKDTTERRALAAVIMPKKD